MRRLKREVQKFLNSINKIYFYVFFIFLISNICGFCAKTKPLLLPPQGKMQIQLFVGQEKLLKVFDTDKVSLVNDKILNIRVIDEDELLLIAKKEGTTDLIFWNKEGKQHIVTVKVVSDLSNLASKLKSVLSDIENLKVEYVGDKIILSGNLLTKQDYEKIEKVVSSYGKGKILNLTTLDRGVANLILEEMLKKNIGVDSVKLRIVGEKVFLTGVVYSPQLKEKAEELVKTQFKEVVNLIQVQDPIIESDVLFLQIVNTGESDIGRNFLSPENSLVPQLNAQATIQKQPGQGFGGLNMALTGNAQLTKILTLLFKEGKGKILANPRLITKSGQYGRFHSGGEFYYEVSGTETGDLKSIEYGLILEVKPKYIGNGLIENTIKISITIPVEKTGSEDLNLDKFSTTNTVVCRLGESIVLSGFNQFISNRLKEKFPILGDIPILNLLFGQQKNTREEKELILIITPRISKSSQFLLENMLKENKLSKEMKIFMRKKGIILNEEKSKK